MVSRQDHGQSGALLAYRILTRLGMPAGEGATIMGAIGNHGEEYGVPDAGRSGTHSN